MTHPYRLLVLDLDGTTLTAERRITPRDVEAARALREHGVQITIATGRLFTGTQWVARELGITGSVAVMNGSELVDADSGVATHGHYVDPVHRERIREVLAEHGLSTFLFGSRTIHYALPDAHHAPYLQIWTEQLTGHPDVFAAPAWDDEDLVAVSAIGTHEVVEAARDTLLGEMAGPLGAEVFDTFGGDRFLNIRSAVEDKGTALARLASERGCTPAECVAVWDWLNDLPMLRRAGRSFAMAEACTEVCDAANEVLSCVRHGGGAVAEVARRVWDLDV